MKEKEKNSRQKKKEKEVLFGWNEISNFLNVSTRTSQRYASKLKDPLPIKKSTSGRVFIEKEELLKWIERNTKTTEKRKKRGRNIRIAEVQIKPPEEKRKISDKQLRPNLKLGILILLFLLFSLLVIDLSLETIFPKPTQLPITVKIKDDTSTEKTTITIYNAYGKEIRDFVYTYNVNVVKKWFTKTDLNGDGYEDIIVVSPKDRSVLLKFTQDVRGKLKLTGKKLFMNEYSSWKGHIQCLKSFKDNGKMKIGVILVGTDGDSSFLIFDSKLKKLLYTIIFNGELGDLMIGDFNNDGKLEFYITGRRNYTNEDIIFGIEGNLEGGKRFNLTDPVTLKITRHSPPDCKIVCVKLGGVASISKEIITYFLPPIFLKCRSKDYFLLGDLFFKVSDALKVNKDFKFLSGTKNLLWLREFGFGYMLKFKCSWWNYTHLEFILGKEGLINFLSKEYKNIIKYWDGSKWTDNWQTF